jgi:hypothetical protein
MTPFSTIGTSYLQSLHQLATISDDVLPVAAPTVTLTLSTLSSPIN